MKIKLFDGIIDTSKIKRIRKKPIKLQEGLKGEIKPHYSIEFNNGNFMEITKQEYKLIKKFMEEKDE